jgi:hypothetical protein
LHFYRPNPASATARLGFSGARLPNSDAKQLVLLDRELIIGPTADCHIAAPVLTEPVTLVQIGRQLCARNGGAITSPTGPLRDGQPLPMDTLLSLGPLRLQLKRPPTASGEIKR